MVMSRISVEKFLIEARALRLLVFFMIVEQMTGEAYNMVANPRMAVHSRTDKACTNANYGQLKIH